MIKIGSKEHSLYILATFEYFPQPPMSSEHIHFDVLKSMRHRYYEIPFPINKTRGKASSSFSATNMCMCIYIIINFLDAFHQSIWYCSVAIPLREHP